MLKFCFLPLLLVQRASAVLGLHGACMQIHEIKEFAVAEHVKKIAVVENQHAAEVEALQQQIEELTRGRASPDQNGEREDYFSLREYEAPVRT